MNEESITKIVELAAVERVQEAVKSATPLNPMVAIPSGMKVAELDLEKYMPQRNRMQYRFNTPDIRTFIRYANAHSTRDSVVFTSSKETRLEARCVFDFGNAERPLHREYTSVLEMRPTAAYSAFLKFINCKLTQRQASDFIQDWSDHMVFYDAHSTRMEPALAAERITKMTADEVRQRSKEVGQTSSASSISEKIELKNAKTMPAYMEFKANPYSGFQLQTFMARVDAIVQESDDFYVRLKPLKLEAMQEMICDEFADILGEGLNEELDVYLES